MKKQRLGLKDSEVRERIIEAAIEIALAEGCSAITAGRLAKAVELSRQSIHYYFGTIEDLIIEMMRVQSREARARAQKAFESGDPLQTMWTRERATAALTFEVMAMARRSEKIRDQFFKDTVEINTIGIDAVERYCSENGIDLGIPPRVLGSIITNLSYFVASAKAVGLSEDDKCMIEYVENWLSTIQEDPKNSS